MRWNDLEAFLLVADELSFSGAARRLHVSRPVVSDRIARLESALGVRLFDRTTTRVSLTPAGRNLLDWAVDTTTSLEDLRNRLAAGRSTASPRTVGFFRIPPNGPMKMLSEKVRVAPRVVAEPADGLADLRAGRIDALVGYRGTASVWPPDDGLRSWEIVCEDLVVVLWDGHPAAGAALVDLAALADERWIASTDLGDRQHLRELCARCGFSPRIQHVTAASPIIRSLVLEKRGVHLASPAYRIDAGMVRRPLLNPPSGAITVHWRSATPPPLVDELGRAVARWYRAALARNNPAVDALVRRDGEPGRDTVVARVTPATT